jgi:hypothetical protein
MPAANLGDEPVCLWRPPRTWFVLENRIRIGEQRIDYRPRCFYDILSREECGVTHYRIAEQTLVIAQLISAGSFTTESSTGYPAMASPGRFALAPMVLLSSIVGRISIKI